MSPTLHGSIIFRKHFSYIYKKTLLKNVVKLADAKLFLSSIYSIFLLDTLS